MEEYKDEENPGPFVGLVNVCTLARFFELRVLRHCTSLRVYTGIGRCNQFHVQHDAERIVEYIAQIKREAGDF